MKRSRQSSRPVTGKAKFVATLGWCLLGAGLGCLFYPFIWHFILPSDDAPGLAQGVALLNSSPLAWAFVAGTAWGLGLVPRIAASLSTDETYHLTAKLLALRWLLFLVVGTGIIVVLAQGKKIDLNLLPLAMLAAPLIAAMMVILGPVRRRGPMDGF